MTGQWNECKNDQPRYRRRSELASVGAPRQGYGSHGPLPAALPSISSSASRRKLHRAASQTGPYTVWAAVRRIPSFPCPAYHQTLAAYIPVESIATSAAGKSFCWDSRSGSDTGAELVDGRQDHWRGGVSSAAPIGTHLGKIFQASELHPQRTRCHRCLRG